MIVEADGEWHTEDGKLGSLAWLKQRALKGVSAASSVKNSPAPRSGRGTPAMPEVDRKPSESLLRQSTPRTDPDSRMSRAQEVFVLDDEDDTDEEEAPARKSSTRTDPYHSANSSAPRETPGSSAPASVPPPINGITIDLTEDSDDDDAPLSNAAAGPSRLPYQVPPRNGSSTQHGLNSHAGQSNGQSTNGTNGSRAGQNGGYDQNPSNRTNNTSNRSSEEELLFAPRTPRRARVLDEDDYDPLFPPKRPRLSTGQCSIRSRPHELMNDVHRDIQPVQVHHPHLGFTSIVERAG